MVTNFLPSYTMGGHEVYEEVPHIVGPYGKKVCIIGGETALSKVMPILRPILEAAHFIITGEIVYGKECSYERAKEINSMTQVVEADVIFAVGGGKAIDTAKIVSGYQGQKRFFTFPTVASTCAATSRVAAVYTPEHIFSDVYYLERQAMHCFINCQILVEAPKEFVWAGMGDTIAKFYEPEFSSRGKDLIYETSLGLAISKLCEEPIKKYGVKAMDSAKTHTRSHAFDLICMAIIVSTGAASSCLAEEYNSNLAHAICYGASTFEVVETKHLHGEIVSYGVMVLLTMDKQLEERATWLPIYKRLGWPTCLADLELTKEAIPGILDKVEAVPDTNVSAYKVTREMVEKAILELENLQYSNQ